MSRHVDVTVSIAAGSANDLGRFALDALAQALDTALRQARPRIEARTRALLEKALFGHPMTREFLVGRLGGEMGVVDANGAVLEILGAVVSGASFQVEGVRVVGNDLAGGMTVGVLRTDLQDALSAGAASFTSPEHGHHVPWLEWLLTGGGAVLISSHRFLHRVGVAQSRTGQGIMVKAGSRPGWSVSPQYAGTREDNWLTRAFEGLAPQIGEVMLEETLRGL